MALASGSKLDSVRCRFPASTTQSPDKSFGCRHSHGISEDSGWVHEHTVCERAWLVCVRNTVQAYSGCALSGSLRKRPRPIEHWGSLFKCPKSSKGKKLGVPNETKHKPNSLQVRAEVGFTDSEYSDLGGSTMTRNPSFACIADSSCQAHQASKPYLSHGKVSRPSPALHIRPNVLIRLRMPNILKLPESRTERALHPTQNTVNPCKANDRETLKDINQKT